jgi:predicted DsbA family dithiol-disulfide isomerase
MATSFEITFDYLCPFARNANEAVVDGLDSGAAWDVRFRPFSLSQTKVDEGETDVWDRSPDSDGVRGVPALQWGLAVRDGWPESFMAFHVALFAARHERGVDIGDAAELARIAAATDLDPDAVGREVESGRPLRTLAAEHQELVANWGVFGVPTFILGSEAVFVRIMERHQPEEIDRIVAMVSWTNLNEFKRTRIPR